MKRVLTVNDEGYNMWTILVDEDKVEHISNLIENLHYKFYDDEELQIEYGGYYEYITIVLDKIDDIELLAIDILEL